MSKILSYIFIFSLIVLSLVFGGCGSGTDTGNPQPESLEGPGLDGIFDGDVDFVDPFVDDGLEDAGDQAPTMDDGDSAEPDTDAILNAVCDSLASCFDGVNTVLCRTKINVNDNMLEAFGVNTTVYGSFDAIQAAINLGELEVSFSEISACIDAIEAVSCEDMDGAFDESNPSDFSDVYLMIPGEC